MSDVVRVRAGVRVKVRAKALLRSVHLVSASAGGIVLVIVRFKRANRCGLFLPELDTGCCSTEVMPSRSITVSTVPRFGCELFTVRAEGLTLPIPVAVVPILSAVPLTTLPGAREDP